MTTSIDERLQQRLIEWRKQADSLRKVEEVFLQLEGSEKSLFGKLYIEAEGRNVEERKAIAYDSEEWRDFQKGLAEAKSQTLHERRLLEIKQKAFDAEYLALKSEMVHVKRGSE